MQAAAAWRAASPAVTVVAGDATAVFGVALGHILFAQALLCATLPPRHTLRVALASVPAARSCAADDAFDSIAASDSAGSGIVSCNTTTAMMRIDCSAQAAEAFLWNHN